MIILLGFFCLWLSLTRVWQYEGVYFYQFVPFKDSANVSLEPHHLEIGFDEELCGKWYSFYLTFDYNTSSEEN